MNKPPFRWPLNAVLFVQLLLAALMPLLVVAVFMGVKVQPQLFSDISDQKQSVTSAMGGQIETHLNSAERELTSLALAVSGDAAMRSPLELERLLDSVVRDGELYEAIYFVGADSRVQGLGLPHDRRQMRNDLRMLEVSRRDFVRAALADGQAVWSPAFLSVVSGRLTVAVALPVRGGVLVGELALSQLSVFLRKLRSGAGMQSIVLDSFGNVIAHPEAGQAGQQVSLVGLDLIRAALAKGSAFGEATLDGTYLVGSALKIRQTGWAVFVGQPERLAYRSIEVIGMVMLAGLLFAILLATFAAALAARSMATKFGHYARNAAVLARGRYDLEWPRTSVREFAALADDLQNTAQAIRRRESALKESEQRLLATLENTPNVAIQWFDAAGQIVYWSKSSETLYGVTAENAIGRTLENLIYTGPQQQAFLEMLGNIATDGQPVGPYEAVFRRPDGQRGVVLCTTFAISGEGREQRFASMDIEVTQQKVLTEKLEQRERRFRALIEQSPIAVIEWDLDFQVREWNEAAEKTFGYSRQSVLGRNGLFIIPPEVRPLAEQVWGQLRSNTGGSRSENDNLTADGRRITCQWYNRTIVDEHGALVAVLSLVEDVTERRRMERALKASEQKFLALFHASPVAVSVSQLDGPVSFLDCNTAWERQFGWAREEMQGKTGLDLSLWLQEAQRIALLDALTRQGWVSDMEVSLRRRNGRTVICLISGRDVDVDGQRLVIFAYHDVTEERKIQQEIRELNAGLEQRVANRTEALGQANQELQSALDTLQRAQQELVSSEKLAALGALVAGVAHELNTPIGNSLMAASTLDEHAINFRSRLDSGAIKRSELDRYVLDSTTASGILMRNLQKASDLVSSFKQVAVDQTSAQRRDFELDEVVSEILLTLRPSYKRTSFEVAADIPAHIHLDSYPGPLGQVLTNFINNALVHAFEGRDKGEIHLCARMLDSGEVRLEVSDDGVGISPQHLGRIFDPFFTTRMGKGGSGLGLHIAHNIVTRVLGGRIGVNSSPAGSTFWLEIPQSAPEADDIRDQQNG